MFAHNDSMPARWTQVLERLLERRPRALEPCPTALTRCGYCACHGLAHCPWGVAQELPETLPGNVIVFRPRIAREVCRES